MTIDFFDNREIRPAKSGEYYVITENGNHRLLNYSTIHHAWNVQDDPELYDPDVEIDVVCWSFKPKTHQILLNMIKRED